MAELLLILIIASIIMITTMPILTQRNRLASYDADAAACIKNYLVPSMSLDISKTACAVNTTSPCCMSLKRCEFGKTDSCLTFMYYAEEGKNNDPAAARKALREACDRGACTACEYFVTTCQKNSANCNFPDEYDMYHYINLATTDINPGRAILQDIAAKYYNMGYNNIKTKLGDVCCQPDFNTACAAKGMTSCSGSNPMCICPAAPTCSNGYTENGTQQVSGTDCTTATCPAYICNACACPEPPACSDGYSEIGTQQVSGAECTTATCPTYICNTPPWGKRFGGTSDDRGYGIDVESDYVYLTGYESSDTAGLNDIFAIKLNSQGNVVWKKKFGGANYDVGRGIVVESGEAYIIGEQLSNTTGGYDVFAIKLDSQGNVIWKKKFGGANNDYGYGIDVESGYAYLTGYQTSNTTGGNDIFAIKLDSQGNVIWNKKFGGVGHDAGHSIAVESSEVYITGYENSDAVGNNDVFAIKLDTNGNVIWRKKFGGTNDDYGEGIAVASGYIYLSGYEFNGTVGSADTFALKLDNQGNVIWKKKFGGTSHDNGSGIAVESGNVYISGYESSDTAGGKDIFSIKLDTNGNMIWKKKFGGGSDDYAEGLAVESGSACLTGYEGTDTAGSNDIFVLKLSLNQTSNLDSNYNGVDLDSTFNGSILTKAYRSQGKDYDYFDSANLTFTVGNLNANFTGTNLNSSFDGVMLNGGIFFGIE